MWQIIATMDAIIIAENKVYTLNLSSCGQLVNGSIILQSNELKNAVQSK